ncbi:MAG: extracellular solute-binding protein [Ruminococcaceae bacterium]|nr:extracellular solute-binding protein [Oscillospiraceae bacterium]
MSKKTAAILLSALMLVGLMAGCSSTSSSSTGGTSTPATPGSTPASTGSEAGGDSSTPATGGENISLRVWGPQEEQALLKEMCEAFAAENPDNTYTFEYGVVGENDARDRFLEDPAAAADVFMFANDHLRDLVKASALYEVTRNRDDIISRNVEGSVAAASLDEALYAYPMTADNGYFLYYDSSVLSEDDVQTLDGILAVANENGKKVFMDVSNGYYIVSFFFGAGDNIWLEGDAQKCDFNNEAGLAAAESIKTFTADPAFITGEDAIITGGMGESIIAGVSGVWNAEALQEKLGDNFAATKLPTFTLNGEQAQMGSFAGYKLVGVNSLTSQPVAAMDLANWLTNQENQTKRFETRQLGPSNTAAAADPAVKENIALNALAMQSAYAKPQNDVLGGFWNPAEAFGNALEAKDYSVDLQTMLDNLVSQVEAG